MTDNSDPLESLTGLQSGDEITFTVQPLSSNGAETKELTGEVTAVFETGIEVSLEELLHLTGGGARDRIGIEYAPVQHESLPVVTSGMTIYRDVVPAIESVEA